MNKGFSSKLVVVTKPKFLKDTQFNGVAGFFDGAAKDGLCAVGVALLIHNFHIFKFKLHFGTGANMKDELLALWCLCKVVIVFGIVSLQVFGDSRVTIK